MTRTELMERLGSEYPNLTKSEIEHVVRIFFGTISGHLENAGRVELRGFGVFTARERKARIGRNPSNGELVDVDQKLVPFFKIGKDLHDRLNAAGA